MRATREQKRDPNTLTLRDLEILQKHTIEGKTQRVTAMEMGISKDVIKRTKRKPAYNQLAQAALEEKGYTVDRLVSDLIAKTKAQKDINIGGSCIQVDDNVAQLKAIERIGDIYGVNAPKDISITGIAGSSDAEIFEELEEALQAARVAGADREQGSPEEDAGTG
jgi:predicted DNA-binding protein (UPF0251 family)